MKLVPKHMFEFTANQKELTICITARCMRVRAAPYLSLMNQLIKEGIVTRNFSSIGDDIKKRTPTAVF
ncbi:hypothetical protein E2986_12889 [Frieseomelitta varia]|uniref:Uncharacterized protein n=1 Tax=Frieseomelitta varia TaxID=561572 RepID=A0A833RS27_9HYME|nr:hypothetical protein E2986_12889 [Frieseomelitta varia]